MPSEVGTPLPFPHRRSPDSFQHDEASQISILVIHTFFSTTHNLLTEFFRAPRSRTNCMYACSKPWNPLLTTIENMFYFLIWEPFDLSFHNPSQFNRMNSQGISEIDTDFGIIIIYLRENGKGKCILTLRGTRAKKNNRLQVGLIANSVHSGGSHFTRFFVSTVVEKKVVLSRWLIKC